MRWQYAYGQDEWFNSISQTKDGGLLATGGTGAYGNGDGDGWCLRLTANGKVKWQVTYGGSLGDWLLSGRQAADGSFTLAGTTESFSFGKTDYFFIRVPSDGFSCSQITGTSNIRPMKMNTYVLTPTVKSKRLVVSPRTSKCVPVDTRCVITDACLTTRALGVGLR